MRLFPALALVLLATGCALFRDDEVIDPPAELEDFEQTLRVERLWSAHVGGGRGSALAFWRSRPGRKPELLRLGLAPASDGGRIYAAAYDGRVIAHDVVKGRRYWVIDTRLPLSAGPGVGEGMLVLGSIDGQVLALATLDGAERWRVHVQGEVLSPPAVGGGVAVVRSVDGKLHGLSLADGAELWSIEQNVPLLSLRGTSQPVIAGTIVVCGFDNGRIAAVDLASGATLWEYTVEEPRGRTTLERLADVDAAVVIRDDQLFAASYQGGVASIALESGTPLWAREMSSEAGLAVSNQTIFVSDALGDLHALRGRDGVPVWTQTALHQRGLTAPAIHQGYVVVGDFEGYLHWLDADTGALAGRVRAGGDPIAAAPIVVDSALYVQTTRGDLRVYALQPRGQR